MIYKCNNCKYTTQRACDLRRHQSRKYPCNRHSKDKLCNYKENKSDNVTSENNNDNVENNNGVVENNNGVVENNNDDVKNVDAPVKEGLKSNLSKQFTCEQCKKSYKNERGYKDHLKKCTGLNPLQCQICLKVFTSRFGKANHKKYVKCKPPTPSPHTVNNNTINNNITNNIDNSTNITNNINIRNDFYKISQEDIDRIVECLGDKEYFQMAMNNIDLGKYAIPRTVESIYFNDKFPSMQTIKKERRNDKMVDVHVGGGKWEKRFIDDVFKLVVRRVEEYYTKYFQHIDAKYKKVPVGSVRWKQLMRPIKTFGNSMLWYDGFHGDIIEGMGIELNYPDDEDPDIEKERERRIKEMEQLVGEKVYEESLAAARRSEAAIASSSSKPVPALVR